MPETQPSLTEPVRSVESLTLEAVELVTGEAEALAAALAAALLAGQSPAAGYAAVGEVVLASVGQLWRVGSAELAETAGALARLRAACDAALVALTRDAVARGVVAASTAANPTAWLAQATGSEPREVSPIVGAAAACSEPANAVVADRVLAGTIGAGRAVRVVREVDKLLTRLPSTFDRAVLVRDFLTVVDAGGTRADLSDLATRLLAHHGGDALEGDVARQHDHETLSWRDEPSGMIAFRACLAADHAALLIAAVQARSAPASQVDPATGVTVRDVRSAGKRRADALIDLVTRAVSVDAETPMGAAATLIVTIDHDTLHTTVTDAARGGCAITGQGTTLDAGALRRYACDANIIPVVLGASSAPLDVGRTRRLATRELRVALALRDRGCTFPGCDRPPGWCRAHHLIPWAAGGTTSLDNLALLCERHHTIVHRDHLTATITTEPLRSPGPGPDDGTGSLSDPDSDSDKGTGTGRSRSTSRSTGRVRVHWHPAPRHTAAA